MAGPYIPLEPATPAFDDAGTPYSDRYGDVYHTVHGALAQAEHVFIRGNGLPERWQGRASFTVCETGFGLGLNFLALWRRWRDDPARPQRLHMISIEAHPFRRADLTALQQACVPPELAGLAAQLQAQWPTLLPGLHRLEFEGGALTLTLAFGRAEVLAGQILAQVDAYFLDGFAPSRNPDMWDSEMLHRLTRRCAPDATAATWSSAGAVRRALETAGFEVRRQPGFGGKREMTVAQRRAHDWNGRPSSGAQIVAHRASGERHAIVVGGGLAGAGVAQALALRGWRVTVLDHDLARHDGHIAAALTPAISKDDNIRARLSRAGSQRALRRWMALPPEARPLHCGTVQVHGENLKRAAPQDVVPALAFPPEWVRAVSREEGSELAGLPLTQAGLFFADGLRVQPDALCRALLATPGVEVVSAQVAQIRGPEAADKWQALDAGGQVIAQADTLVLANGLAVQGLLAQAGLLAGLPDMAGMFTMAGEIVLLEAGLLKAAPRCVVSGNGYFLPALGGVCALGTTYLPHQVEAGVSLQGQHEIMEKIQSVIGQPLLQAGIQPSGRDGLWPGWAGWRVVMPGRLPAIGPVPGAAGLWVATGYASMGVTWSALAGDVIGSLLEGEPVPLEQELLQAIAPR